MPKRNVERSISEQGERNLARRIERERTGRGWSYEQLAREMTKAGCPITKAALYNIEQGEPPRRITVDELLALAAVFTAGDVAELLLPMEALDKRVAHDLIERFDKRGEDAARLAAETFNVAAELRLLGLRNQELLDYVMNQLEALQTRSPAAGFDSAFATEADVDAVWTLEAEYWRGVFKLGIDRADAIFEQGGE